MFWSYMSTYSSASFKRATGIHKNVFLEIIEILNHHKQLHRKHPTSGNKSILSTEDALLMVLMYYREYRTQYHIGIMYGLSESRVCKMIKEIKTIIVQDASYHLPIATIKQLSLPKDKWWWWIWHCSVRGWRLDVGGWICEWWIENGWKAKAFWPFFLYKLSESFELLESWEMESW